MRNRFIQFMRGRYGFDLFSKYLFLLSVVIILLSSAFRERSISMFFYLIGWIVLVYCCVRVFSKNTQKRYAENQKFMERTSDLRGYFQKISGDLSQRKQYHIYRCPGCKQKIRIPRGKGKIEVRCPKCGTTFIKHS